MSIRVTFSAATAKLTLPSFSRQAISRVPTLTVGIYGSMISSAGPTLPSAEAYQQRRTTFTEPITVNTRRG
ncbi:MAG: hypothetical protein AB7I48_11780 [Planctomycetaceae bacterium]